MLLPERLRIKLLAYAELTNKPHFEAMYDALSIAFSVRLAHLDIKRIMDLIERENQIIRAKQFAMMDLKKSQADYYQQHKKDLDQRCIERRLKKRFIE